MKLAWMAGGLMMLAAAAAGRPAMAGEPPRCPPMALAPQVDVRIDEGAVRIDHTRSQRDIQGLFGEAVSGLPGTFRTVGLTRVRVAYHPRLQTRSVPHPAGGWCVMVSSLTLGLAIEEHTIYLPAGYLKGSCQYGEVLAHEQRHVEINRQVVREYGARLRAVVRDVAQAMSTPAHAAQPDQTAPQMAHLQAAIAPVLAELVQVRKERNALLDTRDEYAALSRRCPSW